MQPLLILACVCVTIAPVLSSIYRQQTSQAEKMFDFRDNGKNDFEFMCPPGHVITTYNSEFAPAECDRRWGFGCTKVDGVLNACKFFGPVNGKKDIYEVNEAFNFVCPDEGVLAGIKNKAFHPRNDRQWTFKCCATVVTKDKHRDDDKYNDPYGYGSYGYNPSKNPAMYTDCMDVSIVGKQQLRQDVNATVPDGFVCRAWRASCYSLAKEDRIHDLTCCKISTCDKCEQYSYASHYYGYESYPPQYQKDPYLQKPYQPQYEKEPYQQPYPPQNPNDPYNQQYRPQYPIDPYRQPYPPQNPDGPYNQQYPPKEPERPPYPGQQYVPNPMPATPP